MRVYFDGQELIVFVGDTVSWGGCEYEVMETSECTETLKLDDGTWLHISDLDW